MFELNNKLIALNDIREIICAYASKHNIKCENKAVLLVITNS